MDWTKCNFRWNGCDAKNWKLLFVDGNSDSNHIDFLIENHCFELIKLLNGYYINCSKILRTGFKFKNNYKNFVKNYLT